MPGPRSDIAPDTGKVQTLHRMVADHAVATVVRAMSDSGVRPLLLKGQAFARWLYDEPADRPPGDIDLITSEADRPKAAQVLIKKGFIRSPAPPLSFLSRHHDVWRREAPVPLSVELHRTLALLPAHPDLVWRCLSEETWTVRLAGVDVEAPGPAAGAMIVALHAAQHGPAFFKPLQDLERALTRLDLSLWESAADMASRLGGEASFAAGLSLLPQGVQLIQHLGLQTAVAAAPRLVRLRSRDAPAPAFAIESFVEDLHRLPGLTEKLRLLCHVLTPPATWMLMRYPVARRGRRGLLLAYALRPFELLVRIPRSLRPWIMLQLPAPRSKTRLR